MSLFGPLFRSGPSQLIQRADDALTSSWTVLSICSLSLFEFILRRVDMRKERKEKAKDVEGRGD